MTTLRLAWADLRAEALLALCSVLSLAAVLAPLLILAGLRAGVVEGLRDALLEDPRIREVTTAANRTINAATLQRLAARTDVLFLAPRTRTLAASLLLETTDAAATTARVELIPTAPGDPLLPTTPTTPDTIILSETAAARLRATPGTSLTGRLARIRGGTRESTPLPLRVLAIAPPAAFARDAAFVSLPLAILVEDYQDGRADPPPDLSALPEPTRPDYAGFRLYAARLDELPALDAALHAEGIDTVSRASDVAGLLQVDSNLGLLFALVAVLGGGGVLVSLGAGLWANVERKRAALAQLRFLGLHANGLRLFPVAQAALIALAGTGAATAAALLAAAAVNHVFAGQLPLGRPLCVIAPGLLLAAAATTLSGATLVAAAAGTRAARIEPWEGINTP